MQAGERAVLDETGECRDRRDQLVAAAVTSEPTIVVVPCRRCAWTARRAALEIAARERAAAPAVHVHVDESGHDDRRTEVEIGGARRVSGPDGDDPLSATSIQPGPQRQLRRDHGGPPLAASQMPCHAGLAR